MTETAEATIERLTRELAETRASNEHLRAAVRLREAQLSDAVAQLAGGIAHDFNNILAVISGYTSLLVEDVPADQAWRADLQEINDATTRAVKLAQRVLAFSRRRQLVPAEVDVSTVVAELEDRLRGLLGDGVALEVMPGAELGAVWIDRARLEQVLLTLALDAPGVGAEGRRVRVAASSVTVTSPPTSADDPARGSYVLLAITDTAWFVDDSTRVREPLYAEETVSGLDDARLLLLRMVAAIVRRSGGHLRVTSEGERGTCFEILLPR
jgi:signal transduction histidine kinase